jgi:hypothetical protein
MSRAGRSRSSTSTCTPLAWCRCPPTTGRWTADTTSAAENTTELIPADEASGAESSETAVWSRFGDGPLPELPKMAAVGRAFKAASDFGLPEGFASALSHSVVDPADPARLPGRAADARGG